MNPGPSLWFNPAAFATPATYRYGNSGRNIVVGPGTNQIDLSLFKNIPELPRLRRFVGIPTAGTLNYAGNPVFFQRTSREIQPALKLYF